jgi:hypothetical protein
MSMAQPVTGGSRPRRGQGARSAHAFHAPVAERRGPGIALVAVARKFAVLVCFSVGQDNLLLSWALAPADLARVACIVANRNLTTDEWTRFLGTLPYHETCPDPGLSGWISARGAPRTRSLLAVRRSRS